MIIRIIYYLTLIVAMLSVSMAWGQEAEIFDRSLEPKLKNELDAKNFLSVLATIQEQCDSFLEAATSEKETIYGRASSAAATVSCIDKGRGLAIALASDAETRVRVKELLQPPVENAARVQQQANSETDFMGLSWGLGFGFSFGFDDAIDDAEIVNNVVRVKSEKKQQPRALLEFHRYLWCNKKNTVGTRGCGPFVAISATQDKVLSGVGMGFMYGLKAKATDSDGFSVGFGAILDGKVKDLADGFKENEAPPAGETQVRFKEKARWSGLLFVTRTF